MTSWSIKAFCCSLFLLAGIIAGVAANTTISQQIDPTEVKVGDHATLTIQIQNGSANIRPPRVAGLQIIPTMFSTNTLDDNGVVTTVTQQSFVVVPAHAGDFTIPAFDIHTQDGQTLRTQDVKLHVLEGNAPAPSNPVPAQAQTPRPMPLLNGPVVMPPINSNPSPDADSNSASPDNRTTINVPTDKDGRPAKVFMLVTPKTTDAYVGESIRTQIEFYIRLDVWAGQDSLPTIKGSDFLMNNLSVRPTLDDVTVDGEPYRRETWLTAISAPKSGDFPLQLVRDTYWIKQAANPGGFFMNPFARPPLAHENIESTAITFHIQALPPEGRPPTFSGAIGEFTVTGSASPTSVAVGEPVTIHFIVSGEGNFDYVKCPALASDPDWKTYVPSSKIQYREESHTQGLKTFEEAVIPQKNGTLPLPAASFSYFNPNTKQYVTTPIPLPTITVTGSAPAIASTTAAEAENAAAPAGPAALPPTEFVPNRVTAGFLHPNMTPLYRQPLFWIAQGGSTILLILGAMLLFIRSRTKPDTGKAERALRERSLHQEQDAMSDAVRRGDAQAFFLAARHAIQLQLGAQWHVPAEAITLAEVRNRDPHLAEALEPLFAQADEVIYSGTAGGDLDLAAWEVRVRKDLLHPQPA